MGKAAEGLWLENEQKLDAHRTAHGHRLLLLAPHGAWYRVKGCFRLRARGMARVEGGGVQQ